MKLLDRRILKDSTLAISRTCQCGRGQWLAHDMLWRCTARPSARHQIGELVDGKAWIRTILVTLILLVMFGHLSAQVAFGQPSTITTSKTRQPLASLVIDDVAQLTCNRATSWPGEKAKWLLLEGDIKIVVGAYGFRARRAVIRLKPQRDPGKRIHHLWIYLDDARTLPGHSRVKAEAPRLQVTVATRGQIRLSTNLLKKSDRSPVHQFVRDAKEHLVRYMQDVATRTIDLHPSAKPPDGYSGGPPSSKPSTQTPPVTVDYPPSANTIGKTPHRQPPQADPQVPLDPTSTPVVRTPAEPTAQSFDVGSRSDQRILPTKGIVRILPGRIAYQPHGQHESVALVTGGAKVMYQDYDSSRTVTLSADKAVLFFKRSDNLQLIGSQFDAEDVRGIYLEDNVVVISDGREDRDQFYVRAPRAFYNPVLDKAVLLEAVFYTYDIERRIPLYLRAEHLRQKSLSSWSAENATLTNSAFAVPHFSIAASKVTFDQNDAEGTRKRQRFTSTHNTMRMGSIPVGYWPYLAGSPSDVPLRRIAIDVGEDRAKQVQVEVETQWNVFSLLGRDRPSGVDLIGNIDLRGKHGPAMGLNLDYELPRMFGTMGSYLLPQDNGEDRIGGRRDIEYDGEVRGYTRIQHRQYISDVLELSIESAYVSDESFLEEFFPYEASESNTYQTSLYLKHQKKDHSFTFLTKYNVNDFLAQTTTLQTPGYFVDKLPEIGYYQIGKALLNNRLTYYTESHLSHARIRAGKDIPADRGFSTPASLILFGIPSTTSFDSALRASGVTSDFVSRFDTRHELQAPTKMDIFDVVPYIVGRITAYDHDFDQFASEDNQSRYWGAVGLRFHTQLSKVDDKAENRLFDVHRIKHIIEPGLDVFLIGSSIDPNDIPVYDTDVEAIRKGFGSRFGLRNTWQTKRGGSGRWRSVDWIVLNTDFILRSDDTDIVTVIPHYFDYRSEFSLGGDHFYSDLTWMVTDALAATADLTHSFESDDIPTWHGGIQIRHTPRMISSIDYREIEILNSQLLNFSLAYEMTRLYTMRFRHNYSFDESETRDLTLVLERTLPQWLLVISVRHDDIDDEQTVGVSLISEGLGSHGSVR